MMARKGQDQAALDSAKLAWKEHIRRKAVNLTTPAAADEEFSVPHGLNSVPKRFIVVDQDKAGSVYRGVKAWTRDSAYLKCSATSAKVALVFI